MNPGRGGCRNDPRGMPVQVWATWFPRENKPQSFIRGFPLADFDLSDRGQNPFHLRIGGNEIGETSCRGGLGLQGHKLSWNLEYHSTFRVTLSSKGWIGFSRTPHSDASFPDKSLWTSGRLKEIRWDSEYRDTTADTGIVTSGLGPCLFSSSGVACEHAGSIGLRDAIRIGFPQNCTLARRKETRISKSTGN